MWALGLPPITAETQFIRTVLSNTMPGISPNYMWLGSKYLLECASGGVDTGLQNEGYCVEKETLTYILVFNTNYSLLHA